jgi:hypothetical protein
MKMMVTNQVILCLKETIYPNNVNKVFGLIDSEYTISEKDSKNEKVLSIQGFSDIPHHTSTSGIFI